MPTSISISVGEVNLVGEFASIAKMMDLEVKTEVREGSAESEILSAAKERSYSPKCSSNPLIFTLLNM